MIQVAIVRRRLREGKSYEDFRRAWFHTVGFGTSNRMFSVLNAADPREVIVIGMNETSTDDLRRLIDVDVAERAKNPLDEVIEPSIDRTFGILVAEDDFSDSGEIEYREPKIGGVRTDLASVEADLQAWAQIARTLAAKGAI